MASAIALVLGTVATAEVAAPQILSKGPLHLVHSIELVTGRRGLLIGAVVEDRTAIIGAIDCFGPTARHNPSSLDVCVGSGVHLRRVKERHIAYQFFVIATVARPAISMIVRPATAVVVTIAIATI